MFKKLWKFLKDVWHEKQYITWPSKDDLKEGTIVVISMSALVAVFLSVVDWIFSILMRFVIYRG